MGDAREVLAAIHGLHEGGGPRGDGGGRCVVSAGTTSSGLSSILTDDDDAASSPLRRRPVSSSSSSSLTLSPDKMQADGAGAAAVGPLYELSTMLDHLPALRTGLSKHYRGRSQSFTSLGEVSCVEDLAKKTTPYLGRAKASRCYAAALGANSQWSKKITKKVQRSFT